MSRKMAAEDPLKPESFKDWVDLFTSTASHLSLSYASLPICFSLVPGRAALALLLA